MTDLSFGRLGAVLDLRQQLGLDPDPLVRDPLAVGLGLADQRREALAKIRGRLLIEAVVNLAGVDEVAALAAADIDAVQSLPSSAKPAIGSVSRCAQVFFTQLLPRPET